MRVPTRPRRKPPSLPWNWLTLGMLALTLFLASKRLHEWLVKREGAERAAQAARKKGGREVLERSEPAMATRGDPRLFALAGRVDVLNRYHSTVRVRVRFGEEEGACSGALIGRRLILTAGHCVCRWRRVEPGAGGIRHIIDGSACAETAIVETKVYEPVPVMVDEVPARWGTFQGAVRPHPELKILLDAQGEVASSHADLAVIVLDEALEEEFQPVALAERDVRLGEGVIIVGSGHDELSRQSDGERRSSRNKVTQVLPSGGGRMRIEQPGGHHYKGDSGGPCLREGAGGAELVGISSRNLGEGAAMTSTYGYRDWLREEIEGAKARKPPGRSDL